MKDKKWLKKELAKLKTEADARNKYGSNYTDEQLAVRRVFDLIDQLDEPETISEEFLRNQSDWVNLCHTGEKVRAVKCDVLRNVLVPKVNEPEITEEQAWNKIAESYPGSPVGMKNAFEHFYYGGHLEKKPEKPVIPQFVANWIEEARGRHYSLYLAMFTNCPDDIHEWIVKYPNSLKFARAWDGYTVEKEPLYIVAIQHATGTIYFERFNNTGVLDSCGRGDKNASTVYKFKDKSKAEAVALLVDGQVEVLEE